jgi:hypothetical protein
MVVDVPAPDADAMVAGGRAAYVPADTPLSRPAPVVVPCIVCGAIRVEAEFISNYCRRHGQWAR